MALYSLAFCSIDLVPMLVPKLYQFPIISVLQPFSPFIRVMGTNQSGSSTQFTRVTSPTSQEREMPSGLCFPPLDRLGLLVLEAQWQRTWRLETDGPGVQFQPSPSVVLFPVVLIGQIMREGHPGEQRPLRLKSRVLPFPWGLQDAVLAHKGGESTVPQSVGLVVWMLCLTGRKSEAKVLAGLVSSEAVHPSLQSTYCLLTVSSACLCVTHVCTRVRTHTRTPRLYELG